MACKIIPVIDLQAFPSESAKLIEACEEWGCFRIVNYEEMLPESLLREMRNVAMALFALPTEIKMKNGSTHAVETGYLAPSPLNPLFESLGLYDAGSLRDIGVFCTELGASPTQRKVIFDYARGMNEVKVYIARKIVEGLGVKCFSFEDWSRRFRINNYCFTPQTVTSSGVRLHTDPGFLTLLHDDKNVGGLEVMTKSGEFVVVDPLPNTLIVNLGDIAAVWSNGRLMNVKHRVICKKGQARLTIASFLTAPRVGTVGAPPELVNSQHPRLFSPFTYEEFMRVRLSGTLFNGEAIDRFRN